MNRMNNLKKLTDSISKVHFSWLEIIERSIFAMDREYLEFLDNNNGFFPNIENFLNPFLNISLNSTKYILFGQDPYPRKESACGWAFIDAKVQNIFIQNKLSKEVNKATSLRNFMKMLIASNPNLDSSKYINSIFDLRDNFEKNGILLLNRTLIFEDSSKKNFHKKMFKNFYTEFLNLISSDIKLILLGNDAKELKEIGNNRFKTIDFEHPYNISFISNKEALKFFSSMNLLEK